MNNNNISTTAAPSLTSTSSLTPTWMIVCAYCLAGSIIVVGGIGNLTIIILTALNKQLRTKQHIYFLALTVSDLIVTSIATPQNLEAYVLGHWTHSLGWCRIYIIILSLAYCSSLNFVALIARDRMLIVTKGPAYDAYESGRRKWLYVAIDVVALPVLLIPYTSLDIFTGFSLNAVTGQCAPEQLQNLYVTIANQLIFSMAPFAFMLYYYTRVRRYLISKRYRQQIQQQSITPSGFQHTSSARGKTNRVAPSATISTHNSNNFSYGVNSMALQTATTKNTKETTSVAVAERTQRAVKIMNVLLVTTFTTSLPATFTSIVVNVLLANPKLVEPYTTAWWIDFYGIAIYTCFIAHAVDPILYAYALPSYREALKKLLRRAHS